MQKSKSLIEVKLSDRLVLQTSVIRCNIFVLVSHRIVFFCLIKLLLITVLFIFCFVANKWLVGYCLCYIPRFVKRHRLFY